MKFALVPLEFHFEIIEPIHFPAGNLTNILRGALGVDLRRRYCHPSCADSKKCPVPVPCLYRHLFEGETGESRPSGYREAPRPFVLRSTNWNDRSLLPKQRLTTALNLFDLRTEVIQAMVGAHFRIGTHGLGPNRARLALREIRQPCAPPDSFALLWTSSQNQPFKCPNLLVFDLDSPSSSPHSASIPSRIRAEFLTPTEIKSAGVISRDASFPSLFFRLYERITFLAAHYGSAAFAPADANLTDDARKVATVSQNVRDVAFERFSTRTRQTHPLSGFVGEAVFEGDFSRLWPWLLASQWTGVGRQTVWGKGHIRWTPSAS